MGEPTFSPAIIKTLRFNSLNHAYAVCLYLLRADGMTSPKELTEQQLQIANAYPQHLVQ